MKIMHINASDIGSTGKIVDSICEKANSEGNESVFLFPRRNKKNYRYAKTYSVSRKFEQGLYRRIYYLQGLHYGFAPLSSQKILNIIKREQPDVVHLHSINCGVVNIYRLLLFLKKHNIPTVVTNHAEFFYTGNCPHAYECDKWLAGCGKCPRLFEATDSKVFDRTNYAWYKMKESFNNFKYIRIISVSPWVYSRSIVSPILSGLPQKMILNGVNTDVFCVKKCFDLREKLGIPKESKIILHVTASFSDNDMGAKGGKYLIDLANELQEENVTILILGPYKSSENKPNNIRFMGSVREPELLASYYSDADLCVTVSKRETFGMTVIESMCCGTPVVGFKAGGPESIALSKYSEFVDFGDVKTLKQIICDKWLNYKTNESAKDISEEAIEKYSDRKMATKYCEIYKALCDEKTRQGRI